MTAGRPRKADPGTLYAFAHQFYWDFRRLAEGYHRSRFDEKEYRRQLGGLGNVELNTSQKLGLHLYVEEAVKAGRIKPWERMGMLLPLKKGLLDATREAHEMEAAQEATRQVKVPGAPDVVAKLLEATSPKEIRRICKDSFVKVPYTRDGETRLVVASKWPISVSSPLPMYLSQYAAEFIEAKKDPRFPRSGRPTSQLKQFWFLSRVLAGALYGVKPRTAINLVGSIRPEQSFEFSRSGKPARKTRKKAKA